MYNTVFFDLDGTLTNPANGITKSVEYALSKWNIKVDNRDDLRCFIGPPLLYSFKEYYGFSDIDAQKAVEYYREYFIKGGMLDNVMYDKTEPVLKTLRANNRKMILATSKPEIFAVQILEHFKIDKYFDFICGATLDSARNTKEAVLEYAIKKSGVTELSSAVMVGDRHHDIDGAKYVGIDSIGVDCGFAEKGELKNAGATYIVNELDGILDIILK